ncbi:DUF881 domain-containing protein [Isoptericola sp. b441]|uniref:DUF881 domain-containing protein n=1 Tax=Actinotalea lenta TaxID=3064654 RepID=A0ABT9D7G6_9CELL|nr:MULTISPECIES: DUF881 domain-containing protein [unclassified Isoptericola]MDO8106164.1 DUF881 domain-containing protein [Isoptericola sp. b441]MDO8122117.1 DUF881 domain-containing protein [Isoptericola sp. b490]
MTHRHRRSPAWSVVGIGGVLAFAGWLFAANAQLHGGTGRDSRDLTGLVQAQLDRAKIADGEVSQLRAEVDQLTDQQTHQNLPPDAVGDADLARAAGWTAVHGPGVEVKLSDAPAGAARPDWATDNDLVVHQQDVQAVMNALWAGGAEAMSLQGERVISTSAFRCVGNVLYLEGRVYSPPFVVRAIGNPATMMAALDDAPAVQTYRAYVDTVGLGWSASKEDDMLVPGYDGPAELSYATSAPTAG